MINLFYQEPDPDRWFPLDRYPRRAVRRVLRGPRRPGGQERVFLNLKQGLKRIEVPFRENDFSLARRNPDMPVGIIGKPHLLDHMEWANPILFGASVMSHPLADEQAIHRRPIQRVLVPGKWMRDMFEVFWAGRVEVWPVGIDTEAWLESPPQRKRTDVLLYDKVRWEHDRFEKTLIDPVRNALEKKGLSVASLRYGFYREEEFHQLLEECRVMVFLCEHETQGIAYQQALSCGVPILAWDRGGAWQDPEYYPNRIDFGPVSSVPYWDDRCGEKFTDADSFPEKLESFWERFQRSAFSPRDYILENLTLEKCAEAYLQQWKETFPGVL